MKFTSLYLFLLYLTLTASVPLLGKPQAVVTDSVYEAPLIDHTGTAATLSQYTSSQWLLLVYLGTDCPISQKYTTTIQQIADGYSAQGVVVAGIFPQPGTTTQQMVQFTGHYQLKIPCFTDPTQQLTNTLKATITPEAVLLSPDGQVVYQGAIDNWYYALGKYRPKATEHYLTTALNQAIAGQAVTQAHIPAVGCFINQARQHNHTGHQHHHK